MTATVRAAVVASDDALAGVHPAWLPPEAFRALGSRSVLVLGAGPLVDTVAAEMAGACERFGGSARFAPDPDAAEDGAAPADLVLELTPSDGTAGDEGFFVERVDGRTRVRAGGGAGLLHGFFHVVRLGERAFDDRAVGGPGGAPQLHRPAVARRMLDHWDNVDVHPVRGQVERGYSGGSLFWEAGRRRPDLRRVRDYARLLAATGINALTVNNVNVARTEARLLTDRLDDVVAIAAELRPYGIRTHLSVSFAAPIVVGGLATADPLDDQVREWWHEAADAVHAALPDFGGFVVKADSEGQPGPFAYGRSHADGANLLADALAPHGGVVHWRAFVYNHRQDWRDRTTDRANAAYDHFAPLDGLFRDNVVLQVKHGPIDFQVREPVSPVIAVMPRTRLAVELQVTQEYTGQQQHVCYLAPMWREALGFRFWGDAGPTVAGVAAGGPTERGGSLVAVSNAGDDPFWTGHPLAQANLYAFGRLAWAPELDPAAVLDEWIDLTFPDAPPDGPLRETLHALMDGSWLRYERYTAPLGVGFMVRPGHHYGPDVDGYEYTPWGTYHFADRDGVGVDRTVATGTGFAGRYPAGWAQRYESLDRCPDELLLFFHHVPYEHRLHDGSTVVQHIYDTHAEGAQEVVEAAELWERPGIAEAVGAAVHERVRERLREQVRSAAEWRDQLCTYFYRKSGVPDAHGRVHP